MTLKVIATGRAGPGHLIVGCDRKSVLQALKLPKDCISADLSNVDLISLINDLWTSLQASLLPIHINGHQDALGQELTQLETMNILMDKLVTLTAINVPPQGKFQLLPH